MSFEAIVSEVVGALQDVVDAMREYDSARRGHFPNSPATAEANVYRALNTLRGILQAPRHKAGRADGLGVSVEFLEWPTELSAIREVVLSLNDIAPLSWQSEAFSPRIPGSTDRLLAQSMKAFVAVLQTLETPAMRNTCAPAPELSAIGRASATTANQAGESAGLERNGAAGQFGCAKITASGGVDVLTALPINARRLAKRLERESGAIDYADASLRTLIDYVNRGATKLGRPAVLLVTDQKITVQARGVSQWSELGSVLDWADWRELASTALVALADSADVELAKRPAVILDFQAGKMVAVGEPSTTQPRVSVDVQAGTVMDQLNGQAAMLYRLFREHGRTTPDGRRLDFDAISSQRNLWRLGDEAEDTKVTRALKSLRTALNKIPDCRATLSIDTKARRTTLRE